MTWVWVVAGALACAVYAWRICERLEERPHRYADEWAMPRHRLTPGFVAASAAIGGLTLARQGDDPAAAALGLTVLAVCVPLAYADLDVHRLPDRWLLPAIPAVLVLSVAFAASTEDWGRLLRVSWAVPAALLAFLVLYAAGGGRGLGFGDVKLAALLAVPLAWESGWSVVLGFLVAFLLAGAWAGYLLATGRAGRSTAIAFGPFLMLGAFGVLTLT